MANLFALRLASETERGNGVAKRRGLLPENAFESFVNWPPTVAFRPMHVEVACGHRLRVPSND
jgi:hypothetical protein